MQIKIKPKSSLSPLAWYYHFAEQTFHCDKPNRGDNIGYNVKVPNEKGKDFSWRFVAKEDCEVVVKNP